VNSQKEPTCLIVAKNSNGYKVPHHRTMQWNGCRYILSVMIDKKTRSVVTKNDRKMLVNWCFGIVDSFSFSRETVVVTFNLLHRGFDQPLRVSATCRRFSIHRHQDQWNVQHFTAIVSRPCWVMGIVSRKLKRQRETSRRVCLGKWTGQRLSKCRCKSFR
jgi:hypothetical protein